MTTRIVHTDDTVSSLELTTRIEVEASFDGGTAADTLSAATAAPAAPAAPVFRALAYRPELDGLRAVAVVPVIFYHFNGKYSWGRKVRYEHGFHRSLHVARFRGPKQPSKQCLLYTTRSAGPCCRVNLSPCVALAQATNVKPPPAHTRTPLWAYKGRASCWHTCNFYPHVTHSLSYLVWLESNIQHRSVWHLIGHVWYRSGVRMASKS